MRKKGKKEERGDSEEENARETKGMMAIRIEREMKLILDAWRAAKKAHPEDWK